METNMNVHAIDISNDDSSSFPDTDVSNTFIMETNMNVQASANSNDDSSSSPDTNVSIERSQDQEHGPTSNENITQFNVTQDESWDKFVTTTYQPSLDKNGCRRWPWVRMPWSIAGYKRKSRIICDYWTYKEMRKRLPLDHPIHSIKELEWVDM